MEMPEGWNNLQCISNRLRDSHQLDTALIIQRASFLIKEMAEALELADDILGIYILDTELILKREEDAVAIAKERAQVLKPLKKFKEWK